MDFKESKTRENLMRAFAGESQARNRYTCSAEVAHSAGLHGVERVFRLTADQEKEHAELFLSHLAPCAGESVCIDGGYPVESTAWMPARLLRSAQHNEYEEAHDVYPQFGRIAKEEGFLAVANTFEMIAEIEQTHGGRFGQLAQRLEEERLFKSDHSIAWLCLNCGHVHHGLQAPPVCPVCRHAQGYFVRTDASELLVLKN